MYKKAKTSEFFHNVPEIILLKTAKLQIGHLSSRPFCCWYSKVGLLKACNESFSCRVTPQRVVSYLLLLEQYQKRTICQSASNHRGGLMYIPKISFITGDL